MLRDGDVIAVGTDPEDTFTTAADESAKLARAANQGLTKAQKRAKDKGQDQPEQGITFNLNRSSKSKNKGVIFCFSMVLSDSPVCRWPEPRGVSNIERNGLRRRSDFERYNESLQCHTQIPQRVWISG